MGRSRSSPLGRIISLIEPLASDEERRSQFYTQAILLSLLFFFFLIFFFHEENSRRHHFQDRDPSRDGAGSLRLWHCTWPLYPRKEKKKKHTQQRKKEGAVGAQGSGNNPLSPFKNWLECVALTVRHCGITHGTSGKLGRDPPGQALCLKCGATLCSPPSSGLGLAGSRHTHAAAPQNIKPPCFFFFFFFF